jgi:hypothetical protein
VSETYTIFECGNVRAIKDTAAHLSPHHGVPNGLEGYQICHRRHFQWCLCVDTPSADIPLPQNARMATLHPTVPLAFPLGAGAYRERDVLQVLEAGLPVGWDVFHSVDWGLVHDGRPQIGEVDIAVVSPGGFLLLVEVKSGQVEEEGSGLIKRYDASGDVKDIGSQLRRNHSAVLSRLRDSGLREVRVGSLLVLPDYRLTAPVLGHAPDTVVDAGGMHELPQRVQRLIPVQYVAAALREQLMDFLANRFQVVPDVSSWIGQVQRSSAVLASGLATWVPSISHPSGMYVVQATAGSGKTQLALTLMQEARANRLRCAYVCFNRPLADHLAGIAPPSCEVSTFHELTVTHARRDGGEPDFGESGIHDRLSEKFIADAQTLDPRWDLLILDEHQDFDPAWASALLGLLTPNGRGYVMGDAHQQVYGREEYSFQDAVLIRCMDNFRSPRKVVAAMNQLRLTTHPVVARSAFSGEVPGFHTYTGGPGAALEAVERCVRALVEQGVSAAQMAVITFGGMQNSSVFNADVIAGMRVRRFRGKYDSSGNALWTAGDLLVETVYRFKGQSAPVIVLCEVEFDDIGEKELCKIFVGMTRAQFRLECVLTDSAAELLMARAG